MSTVLTRSALAFHGHDPAPEVHSIVIDHRGRHVVTWEEVFRKRRDRQERSLRWKRCVVRPRPHRLRVAYFDQFLMGGWHAFIEDFRGSGRGAWIDRDRRWLIPPLMRLFPLTLGLGRDDREKFQDWKIEFARAYRRGTHDGRPRGCVYLWWDGQRDPTLGPPERRPL